MFVLLNPNWTKLTKPDFTAFALADELFEDGRGVCRELSSSCRLGRYLRILETAIGEPGVFSPGLDDVDLYIGYHNSEYEFDDRVVATRMNDISYIAGHEDAVPPGSVALDLSEMPRAPQTIFDNDHPYRADDAYKSGLFDALADVVVRNFTGLDQAPQPGPFSPERILSSCKDWQRLDQDLWNRMNITQWLREKETGYTGNSLVRDLKDQYAPTLSDDVVDCGDHLCSVSNFATRNE